MVTCFAGREAADTAEIGCCSVCSRMQTNKGRAAEELAKTAAAAAQRRAAEELAKSAATLTLPSKMLPMLRLLNKKCWLLRRRLPSQAVKGRARI